MTGTRPEADLSAWLQGAPHRHRIDRNSDDYPPLLARVPDPPKCLYVDGDPMALWQPAIAIVGSRSPTAGGNDSASSFARLFAASGLIVVSGLALGIDAAAHRGALTSGRTVAVLGTGPDVVYPRAHRDLHGQIARTGALVSEYPPGTVARPGQFPRRNRIVAGLALGVLVVEASLRSGSLITARLAAEQGREVFAIPGSIHNPLARGCHQLIRQGAKLVETADEVLAELKPMATELGLAIQQRLDLAHPSTPPVATDPKEAHLLNVLGFDPTSIEALIDRTQMPLAELSAMLLKLELDGQIESFRGARYARRAGSS